MKKKTQQLESVKAAKKLTLDRETLKNVTGGMPDEPECPDFWSKYSCVA